MPRILRHFTALSGCALGAVLGGTVAVSLSRGVETFLLVATAALAMLGLAVCFGINLILALRAEIDREEEN